VAVTEFSFLLIALAPFIAAALAPWVTRFAGHHAGWVLSIVPASMFLALTGFIAPVSRGARVRVAIDWIPADPPTPGIPFSFYLDGLSLVFALLIAGIGTVIIAYSGGYLRGHPHQGRFFAFMLAFMGSMMGLVLADSIVTLFVFWELTSITSFLLIGFDHYRQAARRGAIQALIVTSGGGLVLLAGLILLAYTNQTWFVSDMLARSGLIQGNALYLPILLTVLVGAFTKSAQVPFHFWLPNAMEAPTPVSAYLHSATMVKAGVYLLARMHPVLGNTVEWNVILPVVGGVTLVTGAILALRQTDMKMMLAYTTVGTLGMLVMLIGVGTEAAITGAILFLIAHAFYKGALFLIAGTVDHATGTRDVTQVSGLFTRLPVSAVSALLAAISMAGLPVSLGYFAKDVIYTQIGGGLPQDIAVVLIALVGNALMLVVGLVMAIGLFFGPRVPTPKTPHEGPLSMIIGSLLIGVAGIGAGLFIHEFADLFVVASASTVYNFAITNDLEPWHFEMPLLALSAATWALGALVFWYRGAVRTGLRRLANVWRWGPDRGFDQAMFSLVRGAGAVTRFLHHGKLEFYLIVIFLALSAATFGPVLMHSEALPALPAIPHMSFYEWGIMVVALIGLISVVVGRTRLVAIVSLGIQGFAVAIIFMQFGAPDLSFTQFMVEIFSVVILALVMTRLRLDQRDHRILEEAVRDGALAIVAGAGLTVVLYLVLQSQFDPRLSEFFARTSVPLAHGHNIVNVILVDFRALDTLGEITVVLTAGIAILALIRIRTGAPGRRAGGAPMATAVAGAGPDTHEPAAAEGSGAT